MCNRFSVEELVLMMLQLRVAMMMKLCANRWRQSVQLKSKLLLNRPKPRSVPNKKRVARRRRNKRSVVKKRNVSASPRKKPSARPKKNRKLSKCAPCNNSKCRWRSNSATSNLSATVMSRMTSLLTTMRRKGCRRGISSRTMARASSCRRPKL